MGIGQDLLNVPVPQMVYSMAQAIAKGQLALDMSSINTLKILAKTNFEFIPEITETLTPRPITPPKAGGITVTGVDVNTDISDPVKLTLLQAGLTPTFYQFTETLIEVKISISSKTESHNEFEAGFSVEASGGFLFASGSISSHVNYKSSNTYSYTAEGSSVIRTTLKPVTPPPRMMPRFITVNTLVSPAQITNTQL